MSGTTDGHQNYGKWDCKVKMLIGALKEQPESDK